MSQYVSPLPNGTISSSSFFFKLTGNDLCTKVSKTHDVLSTENLKARALFLQMFDRGRVLHQH